MDAAKAKEVCISVLKELGFVVTLRLLAGSWEKRRSQKRALARAAKAAAKEAEFAKAKADSPAVIQANSAL